MLVLEDRTPAADAVVSGNHDAALAPADTLEQLLDRLLPSADTPPHSLHRAMRHAVFPGGKRIRPRLLLAVAAACGASGAGLALAQYAACAVELVHCASLVHDDLPCFDDAPLRRGRPSVHALYGEPLAVLVGDALLSLAFEVLAQARLPRRALAILGRLGQATGSREGIIGGQSLETEALPPELLEGLQRYHAMKTAALFKAAAEAGSLAAGRNDVAAWGQVGLELGLAYQLFDDLCDAYGTADLLGKPAHQDEAHGRPNAVLLRGPAATRQRLADLHASVLRGITTLAPDPAPLHAFLRQLGAPAGRG